MMTLQGDDQIKSGLDACYFYSKAKARNGLSLGIIALIFVASLEVPFSQLPKLSGHGFGLSGERENCVDPLPFLVLMETVVEDPIDGLFD